ncbi:MAG: VWA domain-containing protein [Treponema sp.]|jgi:Ca-activated chloride channel family protein|nr:VWA domain-containing protein [Treponema sp.]
MEEIMFPNKLKGALLGAILSLALCCAIFAEGFAESVSPRARSRYLANNGIILAPEDIYTDSYLASYNYGYPEPETDIGVNIYNKLNQTIPLGRDHLGPEGIIQIGIQGKTWGFAELPPLNLVFVVDTSVSMNDDNKLFWFKTSMGNFIKKIRSIDSLSLVSFSNSAQVVFEPTQMDSTLKRRAFLDAVEKLYPQGLTNLEAGVSLGYEQIIPHYRENSINQVLLFSDGDDFSARLAQSNASAGDVRISLMWNNRNDLDLHVITPTGEEINFNNPRDSNGGVLDIDRNLYGETLKAVENIFWPHNAAPRGSYRVYIQNYLNYETDPYPTPFQIEIKNGKEYLYFEGSVRGSGRSSITDICTFEYTGDDSLDRLQQLVETRKQQGIFLSTIGLGRNFDAEFLRTLAEYGQGASRSLHSRGEVDGLLNTDREFERVAVPAAENLDIELEFTPGIEIVEVLGYQHRIENNRVIYRINGLHQGDYKTLFVRYRIPPQNRGLQVAALHVKSPQGSSAPEVGLYTDGNTTPGIPGSFERVVVLTDPVNDFAAGMLRRSGAVLGFANAVREIAAHYYNSENDLTRLESALQISRETGQNFEALKQGLRNDEAFDPELSVIARYIEILNDRIAENRRSFVNETHSRMFSGREGSFSRMTR